MRSAFIILLVLLFIHCSESSRSTNVARRSLKIGDSESKQPKGFASTVFDEVFVKKSADGFWNEMQEAYSLMSDIFFFGTSNLIAEKYNQVQQKVQRRNLDHLKKKEIYVDDDEKIDSKSLREYLTKSKEIQPIQRKKSVKTEASAIAERGTDGLNSSRDGKCAVGVQYYALQAQPLCGGRECKVYEMNCDGVLYTNFTLFEGNYAENCTVTKLLCDLYELQDLKEQQNASNCKLEKLLCNNNREYNTTQVFTDEELDTCLAQVVCDNSKRYGYQYFGFYCVNETIQCDGNNNCTIDRQTCPSVTNSTTCTDYDLLCEGGISSSGCKFQKLRSQCNANQVAPECKITKVNCNNQVIAVASNATASSIRNCSIVEVNCNSGNQVWTNQTLQGNCVVDQFICSNTTFSSSYNGSMENCTVSKMNCFGNDNASPNNCSSYQFACTGAPTCDYTVRKFTCVNTDSCVGTLNSTMCICPIDRLGDDCGKYRPYSCNLTLKFPALNCNNRNYEDNDPNADLLDGDPACLIFALDENVTLRYDLKCAFQTPPVLTPLQQNTSFTYFISLPQFSMYLPDYWRLRLKIFNFNILSDAGASLYLTLTKEQMMGIQPVWLNTTQLKEIPDRFWHGNRLYGEVMWMHSPPGIGGITLERRFFDSPDYKGQGTQQKASNKQTIILATVLPIVGVILIVGIILWNRKALKRLFFGVDENEEQ